jgi:cytochrome c oxidase subunit 1
MFATGVVDLPFFSIATFIIAVPTGIKFFNWVATMWRGRLSFETPMLWAVGFLFVFLFGGITGVILGSPPIDFAFHDTYYVVAHLHNVLIGGTVFAFFGAMYLWFPKFTGRRLSEPLGRVHFGAWVIGFVLTFLPQYQLGADGMPRRYADYPPDPTWILLNQLSTAGAILLAVGTLPFILAVVLAMRHPPDQPPDPWEANSLEWATSSPPPEHDFTRIPPIRSERPVFDARMAAAGAAANASTAAGPSR